MFRTGRHRTLTTMTTLMKWLAFLHIVGATVWLGAWAAICVFAADAVRQADPRGLRRLFAVMRQLGPILIGPATLLVLGSGVALVARSERVTFGARWVVIGLVLYALVTVIGMVNLRRASVGVARALDVEDLPAAVASARRWLWWAVTVAVLLLLTTWDMVFRP
jgi:uncharacterized membrane protein